ncbi:hypothetical protein Micbo1qcDRAFT_161298 [Microdochium bolleyi]|uniref:DUF1772-domain-containing protein n=1 Tax=Microdochium bolleyi TaxID=196109 RepID=A0A136J819_9PEZI|nr:hypothetical protein Micbo1qcDRAFT_161298 [Microdochium bolleyi]
MLASAMWALVQIIEKVTTCTSISLILYPGDTQSLPHNDPRGLHLERLPKMARPRFTTIQALLAPISDGQVPPLIRLMQAAAVLLATSGAGMSAALSLHTIPRILQARTGLDVAKQWNRMHSATQSYLRICMIWAPSIIHLALGFKNPKRARLYYLLASATLSLIPWSYTRMSPIQWKLERREKMYKSARDESPLVEYTPWGPEDAYSLVELWGSRNLYPSTVSLLAGCASLYAAFS